MLYCQRRALSAHCSSRPLRPTLRAAMDYKEVDPLHVEKAWAFFRRIGSPKFHVAPMVDQSELPFRLLCRQYGATAAYTPMIHSRIFVEDKVYRRENMTFIPEDRPLFVQFCSNNPDHLLAAARHVEPHCDAVDLNLGCPQRIAKRGNYGAFLMDDLQLVEKIVRHVAENLSIPVTCKIRIFPELDRTIEYAKMLEAAGCSLLAVHGRTREMKDATINPANWDYIKAVKSALRIPVLGNGGVLNLKDALSLMEYTGVDGVLSAEPLLTDPALFDPRRLQPGGEYRELEGITLAEQYLGYLKDHPVPSRMVKGHLHKLLFTWLAEHTDLRDKLNKDMDGGVDDLLALVEEMRERAEASGRDFAIPKISARKLKQMEAEQNKAQAIAEQDREEKALSRIDLSQEKEVEGSRNVVQVHCGGVAG